MSRDVNPEKGDGTDERLIALAQANQELEAFASAVAHDLKEPLRSIRLITEFLREDVPDLGGEGAARVARLGELAERAERMIAALREHARTAHGEIRMGNHDLGEIAAEAIRRVRDDWGTVGEVAIQGNLGRVRCDREMTTRVLTALISNGLRFNRSPVRRVEVSATRTDQETTVRIRDNGIGIDPAKAGAVFRIFGRVHSREEFGNTVGAGLTVARRAVDRQGGRLWFESAPSGGTVFLFTLASAS